MASVPAGRAIRELILVATLSQFLKGDSELPAVSDSLSGSPHSTMALNVLMRLRYL